MVVKDVERSQAALDRSVASAIRDVQAMVVDVRTDAVEQRGQLEARISAQIQQSSHQSAANTAQLGKDLQAALSERMTQVAEHVNQTRSEIEQQLALVRAVSHDALDNHVARVNEQLKGSGVALEGRFTTFKASVAANVTEFNTSLMMLSEKVDALGKKISQILKTVVIM